MIRLGSAPVGDKILFVITTTEKLFILNQPEHHRKMTFKEECIKFLNEYEIEYDDKYLFEFYE